MQPNNVCLNSLLYRDICADSNFHTNSMDPDQRVLNRDLWVHTVCFCLFGCFTSLKSTIFQSCTGVDPVFLERGFICIMGWGFPLLIITLFS